MSKYKEAIKAINDFYDVKLIEVIEQIPTDNLNGNGTLDDDEVREVLIYHLDRDLYNRMDNEIGEDIYQYVSHALENVHLPVDEIRIIHQQRRENLYRILNIEMAADNDAIDVVANVMIGHGYMDLEVTHTEAEVAQVREFYLVRRILMYELTPEEADQVIDEAETARILEVFQNDLDALRTILTRIYLNRDEEVDIILEQMINSSVAEDTDSMQPQVGSGDDSSLSSFSITAYSSDGLSPIVLQRNDTVSDEYEHNGGITVSFSGVCPNPDGSSSSSVGAKSPI